MSRIALKILALAPMLAVLSLSVGGSDQAGAAPATPEKVIIDTDIGGDIDDAFAVALALQSPEMQILGISTVSGDTEARARIVDRMLTTSGHAAIPVAVGPTANLLIGTTYIGGQSRFGESAQLPKRPHRVAADFILEQIRRFPGEITLIAIGPLTNLAAVIEKDPQAFHRLRRIVLMGGSVRVGYYFVAVDSPNPAVPEYNILADIPAAQKVFESGVTLYVLPLDSTVQLKLDEVKRSTLFLKGTPLTDSLGLLYLMWGGTTPVLFDAMAVGFVLDKRLCPMQSMHLTVDDKGMTNAVPGKPNAEVCLHSDPETFFRFYLARFP